jgi:exodeoxyribonuclease V gamma subunit
VTLHLHRAERTDVLADGLGRLLATPLPDPFDQEVVAVPAKGVERWLSQRLSHRLGAGPRGGDGVCAGVRFVNPHSLVALLLGKERDDPWEPDRLVWPLLAVIDEVLGEPGFETLSAHLGHGVDGPAGELRRNRRYSVARRLAGLFASYAGQRPALVRDWREGRDTDGTGHDLDDDLLWQAALYRRLLAAVEASPPDVRHAETVARLETGAADLDLPARLSLFGHTRISGPDLELLQALAGHRDVHLWLPQPSPALWDALEGLGGSVERSADTSAERVGHPLLASLGRDSRELRRTLHGCPSSTAGEGEPPPATLLGWLQHDLRANAAPDPGVRARRALADDDRSVQVHACHGPTRQVDVLREVLVGLLDDDPTLEPRDILVMCPDIETFAPLIAAGFGLGEVVDGGHPAHRLRVRLADRALSSTNPLLGVAGSLVELAGGRVTASEVLDLLASEPVRRRFRLTDDDLDRIGRWVAEAGVRWGLDAAHRSSFQMERFEHNTWRSGLDRVLLGVAMSGDDHATLGRGLPLDDVGSGDIDLVGRFAEALDRLGATLSALDLADSVRSWMTALTEGVAGLTEVATDDAWQVPQLERELARVVASGDGEVPLRLSDVRALLQSRLGGRPTRANFRTGTLTVCTMVPMRSVPHRVVCLLGLDDGVFPRVGVIDGDDVLRRRPLTGERDLRSEDRQLLLDAILATREHLVITYTGSSEQSGARRPPAVPLGEVLDALDRTTGTSVRERVLTRHPLQPYDVRNFTAPRPFSFDADALAGARAAISERRPPEPFLVGPLTAPEAGDVNLADLKQFVLAPVRSFVRRRLELSTPLEADEIRDGIPLDLNPLDLWAIGDRLLREVMAGQDPQAVMTAELLRGQLPPGVLGDNALRGVATECQALFQRTADLRSAAPRTIDIDVDLGDDRRLTGTVPGVHGVKVVSLGYSRLKAKQRLATWLDVLALSASYDDENWTGHAIGRDRRGPLRSHTGPLDHRAVEWLGALVGLYDEGRRRPVPAPIDTACAWAEAHARTHLGDPVDPVEEARKKWVTDPHNAFGITGEDDDPAHVRVYGRGAPVEALLDGGLAQAAWTIWEPLLTGAERVGLL